MTYLELEATEKNWILLYSIRKGHQIFSEICIILYNTVVSKLNNFYVQGLKVK